MLRQTPSVGSVAARAYVDRFEVVTSRIKGGKQRRLLPLSTHSELDEPLPTDLAFGHFMMTAGIGTEQFFWCNLCSAYTGDRVRKLARQCDRVQRSVQAVMCLRKDLHPTKGTVLPIPARRMLKADVGCCLSWLDPMSGTMGADTMATSDGGFDGCHTAVTDVMLRPQHPVLEDEHP